MKHRIKIMDKDCWLWLVFYKAKSPIEFVITLNPNIEDAGFFDEDDYIIQLCKENFEQVVLSEVAADIKEYLEYCPQWDWV